MTARLPQWFLAQKAAMRTQTARTRAIPVFASRQQLLEADLEASAAAFVKESQKAAAYPAVEAEQVAKVIRADARVRALEQVVAENAAVVAWLHAKSEIKRRPANAYTRHLQAEMRGGKATLKQAIETYRKTAPKREAAPRTKERKPATAYQALVAKLFPLAVAVYRAKGYSGRAATQRSMQRVAFVWSALQNNLRVSQAQAFLASEPDRRTNT
ncbi:hypothetical protein DIPPA_24686 [Diplonema papillatum]|nr:hypothetical protein DIPPA_24686 [Diplonema papillatum]